jgi:hypothetical protein
LSWFVMIRWICENSSNLWKFRSRNESTIWIFKNRTHESGFANLWSQDLWLRYETNLFGVRIRDYDTKQIHGFAKRIHVFTNLLYDSRILNLTPLFIFRAKAFSKLPFPFPESSILLFFRFGWKLMRRDIKMGKQWTNIFNMKS